MKKEDIRILVVEDDAALGRAIQQLLSKSGYTIEHCIKPDEALAKTKIKPFNVVIADCMLPKMNGVDLAIKLREEGSGVEGVILMSGIFKEKNFIKEAQQKTGSNIYLQKPFDLEELLTKVETLLADIVEVPKPPIFELLANPTATQRDIRKAMESIEIINGFDLPYVYALVLDAKLSGYLNLINDDGSVSGISFANGEITTVDVADKGTFLGSLLVEKGFLTTSALQNIIKSPNERRIGQRLIEENLLSPHALPIVLAEQMSIRLGLTIEAGLMKINFVPSEVEPQRPSISLETFTPFLHDWLFSKVKLEWIESFYMDWMDHTLIAGPNFQGAANLMTLAALKELPEFGKFLLSGKTLSQLINTQTYPDPKFYRGLHLMVVRRMICFNQKKQATDTLDLLGRAKRLAKEMEGKDYFEMFELLGVSRRAKSADILKAYRDFSKVFHPDKLSGKSTPELTKLVNEIFGQITRAYKILTDEAAKKKYQAELEQARVSKFLEAETIFEEAKLYLKKSQIGRALELMKKCCAMAEPTTDMKLYFMWVRMKAAEGDSGRRQVARQIEGEMAAIPPEDRHQPIYFFVKGLQAKLLGDIEHAVRNFEHALALDATLIDAKRELHLLKMQMDEKRDNHTFFGRLFGKKSAS